MSSKSNNNSNKALKAGIGYTIGNILIKGISFLSLPLFSRLMTTDEFGVYNVFISYESILFVLIGLAMHSSLRSANLEFKNQINEYTSSITIIYFLNLIIYTSIVLLLGKRISNLLGFDISILFLLIFYSFSTAILTLYHNRIAIDYAYKRYLVVALINTITNIVFSLVLLLTVFKSQKDVGRIIGVTVSMSSLAVILIISFFKKAKPRINMNYWKFAIKYSIPIVPHGISQVLLAQFDRIMIRKMVSDSAAGIYSLAGNIKIILTLISESISTAWATWFFYEINEGHNKEIQNRAKQLCGMFAVFSIGLMAISPELILILGGNNYILGKYVAIPMIMDAFLLFVYSIVVQVEYYKKKTIYIMTGTMIAAVINVITNYIFIKRYGFVAAAYTTLFSYIVYLILHVVISRKLAGFFVVELKYLLFYILLIITGGVADLLFTNSVLTRFVLCLIMICPMSVWLIIDSGIWNKLFSNSKKSPKSIND